MIPHRVGARTAIDWSLPTTKIGDRTEPLCENTLRRIEKGLKRFMFPSQPFIAPGRTDNMPTGIDEPIRTFTASNQQWLVEPFIDTARSHNNPSNIDDPVATLTTGRNHSLIQPPAFLSAYHGDRDAVHFIDEPSPTIATNRQLAVVQPEAFISSYYGNGGESPISYPAPTMRTVQGHALVTPDWSSLVEDCGYRMIVPHEAQRLQGFSADYQILGRQDEKFRQIGNAVHPGTAEMIAYAVSESLH